MTAAYLEAEVKSYNVENLQTGDLVKMEADIHPIIYHYGIIDRDGQDIYIYHNQASFVNKLDGSIIREDFRKYAKGRKILSVEKTGLDKNSISKMTDLLKDKKYHFINNNCEHFVNKLKSNKFISPTTGKIALSIFAGLTVIWLLKKK